MYKKDISANLDCILYNFRISVYLQYIQSALGKKIQYIHIILDIFLLLTSWQCSTLNLRSDLGDVALLAFTFERGGRLFLGVGLERFRKLRKK